MMDWQALLGLGLMALSAVTILALAVDALETWIERRRKRDFRNWSDDDSAGGHGE